MNKIFYKIYVDKSKWTDWVCEPNPIGEKIHEKED